MKKILKKFATIISLITLLLAPLLVTSPILAAPVDDACAGVTAAGGKCGSGNDDFEKIITSVINILSIIVGAVSVIMIIIGGLRYVISAGDSNGISGAKNTILYALVGLVVVLFAQIIVAFVIDRATA